MGLVRPDRYFSSITSIDIEWDLLRQHLRCVLLDVDNTIRRRDNDEVPFAVRAWLARAQDKGVKLCLLSNNFHDNVYELGDELGIPVIGKAMKPLPMGYQRACDLLEASPSECVMVGDQLLTDVLGAHLHGMKAYLVAPLVDVDLKHTAVMRKIEALVIGDRIPDDEHSEGVTVPGVVATKPELELEDPSSVS